MSSDRKLGRLPCIRVDLTGRESSKQSTRFWRVSKYLLQAWPRKDVVEKVQGVGGSDWQHGGDQEAVTVKVESHFKFAQQLDVLLPMSLWKHIAFEDMREDGGAKNTSLWT